MPVFSKTTEKTKLDRCALAGPRRNQSRNLWPATGTTLQSPSDKQKMVQLLRNSEVQQRWTKRKSLEHNKVLTGGTERLLADLPMRRSAANQLNAGTVSCRPRKHGWRRINLRKRWQKLDESFLPHKRRNWKTIKKENDIKETSSLRFTRCYPSKSTRFHPFVGWKKKTNLKR